MNKRTTVLETRTIAHSVERQTKEGCDQAQVGANRLGLETFLGREGCSRPSHLPPPLSWHLPLLVPPSPPSSGFFSWLPRGVRWFCIGPQRFFFLGIYLVPHSLHIYPCPINVPPAPVHLSCLHTLLKMSFLSGCLGGLLFIGFSKLLMIRASRGQKAGALHDPEFVLPGVHVNEPT